MKVSIEEQLVESILAMADLLKKSACCNSELAHLSIRELQVMTFIKEHQRVKMQEIAVSLKITMPTATVFVDQLFKKGLAERDRDSGDRRNVFVVLTEKGNLSLKKATENRKKKINEMLCYLSFEEKNGLNKILKNLLIKIFENEEKK